MTRREALARHLAMIGPDDPWTEDPRHAYEWADQILELLGSPSVDETKALRDFADELTAEGWAPFAKWARRNANNHQETK